MIKFRYQNETWLWQSGFIPQDKVLNVAIKIFAGVGESVLPREVEDILAGRGDSLAAGGGRGYVLARVGCEHV